MEQEERTHRLDIGQRLEAMGATEGERDFLLACEIPAIGAGEAEIDDLRRTQ